jgi:hypothetical protein
VVITTNALEKLDTALYRKGRVDVLMEIKRFASDEVWRYIEGLYPEVYGVRFELKPMAGCELADLVRTHFDDHLGFLQELYGKYAVVSPEGKCPPMETRQLCQVTEEVS